MPRRTLGTMLLYSHIAVLLGFWVSVHTQYLNMSSSYEHVALLDIANVIGQNGSNSDGETTDFGGL